MSGVSPRRARRPAGKARRPRIPGVFERGATQPPGMHRPSNAARLSPRAVKVIPAHDPRRVVHAGVSDHPTSAWTAQQLRKAFLWNEAPRYLVISISLRADSPMITSIFRRNHFGDAANARV